MTDPAFVVSAYAIVLGGLVLYVISVARRLRTARRTAQALEHGRRSGEAPGSEAASAALAARPSEPAR